jgi:alkaline phosphatase D
MLGMFRLTADNAGVRFHNRERGYVRCTVTTDKWLSDNVVEDDVTRPGGIAQTCASFAIEAGVPGAKAA